MKNTLPIRYRIKTAAGEYWMWKRKDGKYALSIGDTLIMTSENVDSIHEYLEKQHAYFTK